MAYIYTAGIIQEVPGTSEELYAGSGAVFSVQKLPTDPIFYASVVIKNIVVGSRYLLIDTNNDTELASGEAVSQDFDLENIPVSSDPMLVEFRVRLSGTLLKYLPYKSYGYVNRNGATLYVSQVEDTVAT